MNLSSVFVPFVGLVFPAFVMGSLLLYVQKNNIVNNGLISDQSLL